MDWDKYIEIELNKALKNQPEDFGGVQFTDVEERFEPFYIIYKIWPAESQLDNEKKLITIFFDKEDYEYGNIKNRNTDNRFFGASNKDSTFEEIRDTYRYITRNFRNTDGRTIEAIDSEMLKDFANDDKIKEALKANLQFKIEEDTPGQSVSAFIKESNSESAKGVVTFTKKMIKEFGLKNPAKFKYFVSKEKDNWKCCFFFEEGFNFIWERNSYGSFHFHIERNNPNTIKAGKYSIGLKEWVMGESPRHFDIKNYSWYRDFAERILDRAMGRWQVSLDMEE